jgi:hypothetical protein
MVCDTRKSLSDHQIGIIDFESRRILKESESLIQKSILEWLNYHSDVYAFRVNVQGVPLHNGSGRFRPSPHRGIADIIASVKGTFLAIEVKNRETVSLSEDLSGLCGKVRGALHHCQGSGDSHE